MKMVLPLAVVLAATTAPPRGEARVIEPRAGHWQGVYAVRFGFRGHTGGIQGPVHVFDMAAR